MKNLILLLVLISFISNGQAAIETSEVCYYGLYDQDTNKLWIESDSKEYLLSIKDDYEDIQEEEFTTIEISQCTSEEIQL